MAISQPSMLVTGTRDKPTATFASRMSEAEWAIIGVLGLVFVILGGMDLVLVWYPPAFGTPEWEFTTVTASFNGLPVPTLGIILVLVSGVARRKAWQVKSAAILMWCVALFVIGAAILYATTVPMALGRMNNAVVKLGLFKAVSKTVVQSLCYPLLFIYAGVRGWRAVSRSA